MNHTLADVHQWASLLGLPSTLSAVAFLVFAAAALVVAALLVTVVTGVRLSVRRQDTRPPAERYAEQQRLYLSRLVPQDRWVQVDRDTALPYPDAGLSIFDRPEG